MNRTPRHARLRKAAISLAVVPTSLFATTSVAVAAPADQVSLNIIGITDFHGHIEQVKDKSGAIKEMGAGALACYLDKERAAQPNTSFVSAGDNIGGSPFVSSILHDKPTLDVLNAMKLDVSAVGNHEFDKGFSDLKDRVSVDGTGQASFPYLGGNVEGSNMKPSTVIERDGVKIGYVGVVTASTPTMVSPSGVAGLNFTDPVAKANAEAERLKNSGEADVVIALVHEGVQPSQFSNKIDAVIGGHTHVAQDVDGTPKVIQPDSYGKLLADIDVVYDKAERKVVSVNAVNRTAAEVAAACPAPNATVQGIVDAAMNSAKDEGQKVVATISHDFYRGANNDAAPGSNRGTESSLNSLLADAALYGINEMTDLKADIGVMNAGGVREDLAAGPVTFAEAYAVQPFGNSMAVSEISGADFITLLEQQWRSLPKGSKERPMLALGLSENVQYSYDPTAPVGSRITSVTINGKPIDKAATYRVAGATFLLGEGDGFTAFGTQSGKNKMTDSGLMDVDVFNKYLSAHQDVDVRKNQTSVGLNIEGANPDGTLPDGKEVSVNVSSLSYTAGEPRPSKVTVSLIGKTTVSGAADVDNVITDSNNETGQATVKLVAPAGTYQVKITDDNGTTYTYPIGEQPAPGLEGSLPGTDGSNTSGSATGSAKGSGALIGGVFIAGIVAIIGAFAGGAALKWAYDNYLIPQQLLNMLPHDFRVSF